MCDWGRGRSWQVPSGLNERRKSCQNLVSGEKTNVVCRKVVRVGEAIKKTPELKSNAKLLLFDTNNLLR